MRKILGSLRRAVDDYSMIQDGDKVVVGVSGGKDSMALLTALKLYQRFSPQQFELIGVMIDLGVKGTKQEEVDALIAYCAEKEVELHIVKTNIQEVVFDIRKESNPCSLCAKMRRGALNTKLIELGANKLALGHHSEDMVETFLLSLIYEGRLSTFQPVSYMSRTDITMIRPFIYVEEGDIRGAVERLNMPIVNNPCPMNHVSQREYMKNLVKDICKDIPFAKDRMASAITSAERYNLFPLKNKFKNSDAVEDNASEE
ncbi:MAG: tRNA 2-thiocytidine biosynthesis TtcA family protein [Bacillota bacterium]